MGGNANTRSLSSTRLRTPLDPVLVQFFRLSENSPSSGSTEGLVYAESRRSAGAPRARTLCSLLDRLDVLKFTLPFTCQQRKRSLVARRVSRHDDRL